ncbi:DUF1360 domain-containing protein [Bacillus tianshenii]|nr:DUF1360 domain-containing protein [Bacillus tianshenii]
MGIFMLVFASFRLTRLIVYDTITAFLRKPFHEFIEEKDEEGHVETYLKVKGSGLRYWVGELLSCYWCTGMWSTMFLVGGMWQFPVVFEPIILILAIAGAAAILETFVNQLL